MYSGKLVFAQVMDHLPMHTFRQLLHHAHVLKCGPRSWRTKVTTLRTQDAVKQHSIPVSGRRKWPDLRYPQMAGFDPSTEDPDHACNTPARRSATARCRRAFASS